MQRFLRRASYLLLVGLIVVPCYTYFSFHFTERPTIFPDPYPILASGEIEIVSNTNYQGRNKEDPSLTRYINPDPIPTSGEIEIVTDTNYQGRNQEDPALIRYIQTLLRPPSTKPYRLSNPSRKHFTSMEQSKYVGNLYGPGKRDGFFIEVGALDGEQSSSTLYLERELGFSGLLIEPNPSNYKQLLTKERKSYTLKAALSPTTSSNELLFTGSGQQGHLSNAKTSRTISVKGFPFYSILRALNVTFVDVLNLDIEGFEFKVLKTIPFDKLKFGIFIIEHLNIPEPHQDVVSFMTNLGYRKIHQNSFDYIFGEPEYLNKLPGWKL